MCYQKKLMNQFMHFFERFGRWQCGAKSHFMIFISSSWSDKTVHQKCRLNIRGVVLKTNWGGVRSGGRKTLDNRNYIIDNFTNKIKQWRAEVLGTRGQPLLGIKFHLILEIFIYFLVIYKKNIFTRTLLRFQFNFTCPAIISDDLLVIYA